MTILQGSDNNQPSALNVSHGCTSQLLPCAGTSPASLPLRHPAAPPPSPCSSLFNVVPLRFRSSLGYGPSSPSPPLPPPLSCPSLSVILPLVPRSCCCVPAFGRPQTRTDSADFRKKRRRGNLTLDVPRENRASVS